MRKGQGPIDTRYLRLVYPDPPRGVVSGRKYALGIKTPKNPKNGQKTLLNTCINWGGSDFGGYPQKTSVIYPGKIAKKSALKNAHFWVPKRGGSKWSIFWGFYGFFEVF